MKKINDPGMLWEKTCLGDEKAYADLHYMLYPKLYNYTSKILKDSDATDDILQEVFIKLWNKKNSLNQIKNITAYFYQSTRHLIINHLRKLNSYHIAASEEPDIQFSAEEIIIASEDNNRLSFVVNKALNKLPRRQREIIYFKYFEGMEYQEIVDITGIRYQSVVNHVYRAIQILRAELFTNAA